jgi:glycosidase
MKNFAFLIVSLLLSCTRPARAQVTCHPVAPCVDDIVSIYFNANEGSRGLVGETGDVFMHTGVITSASTSSSDWKHVTSVWGNSTDTTFKMWSLGNGIYAKRFNIRSFYNIAAHEQVLKLAFVFRNGNGSREGKTATNSDIFYDLTCGGTVIQTNIVKPNVPSLATSVGSTIAFKGTSTANGTLTLKDNGVVLTTVNNALTLDYTINVTASGSHTVQFVVTPSNGGADVIKSFTYSTVNGSVVQDAPAGTQLGANLNAAGTSVTLMLQAPHKNNVFVLGSFNNWQSDFSPTYQMRKTIDGKSWWITLPVTPNTIFTYQYLVDGSIKIADPLSTLILDPNGDPSIPAITYPNLPAYPTNLTTGYVSVLEPGKTPYSWRVPNFQRPLKQDLIIYELLVRDFVARHDYQTLIDSINYLKSLKINAIELMPVQEFDNNESWGYNPNFHNAVDKYYGTADKLKEFIDVCHQNGIAVIIDVVFNHTWGSSPLTKLYWDAQNNAPAADNPWLNVAATHPFNVGFDFNHESEYTRNYMFRCLKHWLTEFKIDGYRFDLSKGFTQVNSGTSDVAGWGRYDQSRVNIWNRIYDSTQVYSPGSYAILEHLGDNVEEKTMAERGMMTWGNMWHNYKQFTMCWPDNGLGWITAQARNWNVPHLIGYMESHDEQRNVYENINYGNSGQTPTYNIKSLGTALSRVEMANAFFYTVPGPKMLWQFGELGYDYDINFNGRVGNKPIRWDYLRDPARKRLYDVTRNIIHLRTSNQQVFREGNYNAADLNTEYVKHFHVSHANMNLTVLGNGGIVATDITPHFQNTGNWYNYLTGETLNVTSTTTPIRLLPGEYRIYTNIPLPMPPAGYIRYTNSDAKIVEFLNDFQVYPNPITSNQTTYVGYSLKQSADIQWFVINNVGQIVHQSAVERKAAGSHQEPFVKTLAAGTYMIRLNVNGAAVTQKLVIQ